jgi:hypothetical protein
MHEDLPRYEVRGLLTSRCQTQDSLIAPRGLLTWRTNRLHVPCSRYHDAAPLEGGVFVRNGVSPTIYLLVLAGFQKDFPR